MEKTRVWLIVAICLFLPSVAFPESLGDLRMNLISGDVQISTEDTEDWVAAAINMPLREGDRVWVPEGGRAELQHVDGTAVRLDENTSLDILSLDRDSSQFYIQRGRAYVNFRGYRDTLIQMDTPITSIKAYDAARFGVSVSDEGSTDLLVFRGRAYSENRSGTTLVEQGKMLVLTGYTYADIRPLPGPDSWERWNTDRDNYVYASARSSRYLPDELSAYSYEFDRYGRWVYESGYGYIWRPITVSVGWAPYRHGRWVWLGGDYVWITNEPWGWAPHHYGRWTFITRWGWCWVPPFRGAVYWGPGFVGWVHTPSYVAWVPLAPGEIYYGHGYYGPYSVNIININIKRVVIRNVYKNVYVNNSVTVISRDHFKGGKPIPLKISGNPFLTESVSVGRPDIKPDKITRMPSAKEIAPAKLPPEPVRNIRVKELRESRPVIKERPAMVPVPKVLPKAPARPPARDRGRPPVKVMPSEPKNLIPSKERPAPPPKSEMRRGPETERLKRPPAPERAAPPVKGRELREERPAPPAPVQPEVAPEKGGKEKAPPGKERGKGQKEQEDEMK